MTLDKLPIVARPPRPRCVATFCMQFKATHSGTVTQMIAAHDLLQPLDTINLTCSPDGIEINQTLNH